MILCVNTTSSDLHTVISHEFCKYFSDFFLPGGSNVGREFIVVFMENQIEAQYFKGHSLQLFVSLVSQDSVNSQVNVSYPQDVGGGHLTMTYTAIRDQTLIINLPYYLRVSGSTISNKVIHMICEGMTVCYISHLTLLPGFIFVESMMRYN